jgi:hypothetical protein
MIVSAMRGDDSWNWATTLGIFGPFIGGIPAGRLVRIILYFVDHANRSR